MMNTAIPPTITAMVMSIPYATLAQACERLIGMILIEPEAERASTEKRACVRS